MKTLLLTILSLFSFQETIPEDIITPMAPYNNIYCDAYASDLVPNGPIVCPTHSTGLDRACLRQCRLDFVLAMEKWLTNACSRYDKAYNNYVTSWNGYVDNYIGCILSGEAPGVCNGYVVDANSSTADFSSFSTNLMNEFFMRLDELTSEYWACAVQCCQFEDH